MTSAARGAWTSRLTGVYEVALGGMIGLGLIGIKRVHNRLDEFEAVSESGLSLCMHICFHTADWKLHGLCKTLHAAQYLAKRELPSHLAWQVVSLICVAT